MAQAFTREMLAVQAYQIQIAEVHRRLLAIEHLDDLSNEEILADTWVSDLLLEPIEWDPARSQYLEEDVVVPTGSRTTPSLREPVYRLFMPLVPKRSNPRALTIDPERGWIQRGPTLGPSAAYVQNDEMIVLRGTEADLANLVGTAETAVSRINEDIQREFSGFREAVLEMVRGRRADLGRKEHRFRDAAARLNVEVGRRPDAIRLVDVGVRREVAVVRNRPSRRPSASDPRISEDSVRQIIDLIDQAGRGFEVARSEFRELGEEGLRHVIVGYLNAVFQSTAVTGETFSKDGKPDLVVMVDGRPVLVGECKFWDGAALYAKTLGEQLTRYVTWRQTIAVLVTFSTRTGLTGVVAEARRTTTAHASITGSIADKSETYFTSLHVHPDDHDRRMEVHHLFFNLHTKR